jgi:nonsense-mediated mRNA decay protein 3
MDFCVECGSEERLYGHLCRKCLLSKDPIRPPKHISFSVCGSCGRVLRGSRWTDMTAGDAASEILLSLTVSRPGIEVVSWQLPDFEPEKGEQRLNCIASAELGEDEIQVQYEISVKIRHETCNVCSRFRGDYFEAILQLRGGSIEEAHALALEGFERFSRNHEMGFVSKQLEVSGGMDYYVGSVGLAKAVAKSFRDSKGAAITESSSLIGKKDGRDLYRWTILIRLPLHNEGDIVEFEGEAHEVESVKASHTTIRRLTDGTRTRVKDNADLKLIAKKDDIEDAVVVSRDADSIQVLDPADMKTITLARPACLEEVGESVKVARYKDTLIVIENKMAKS